LPKDHPPKFQNKSSHKHRSDYLSKQRSGSLSHSYDEQQKPEALARNHCNDMCLIASTISQIVITLPSKMHAFLAFHNIHTHPCQTILSPDLFLHLNGKPNVSKEQQSSPGSTVTIPNQS
jgi:hypothetical protein